MMRASNTITVRVQYCANVADCSGYAEAARNNILALQSWGVDVSIQPRRFACKQGDDAPAHDARLRHLLGRANAHTIRIIHAAAGRFPEQLEPGVKNVGCTVWETDKLPAEWIEACNAMDEIWVPCRWNVDVFRAAGVVAPVYRIPHAVGPEWTEAKVATLTRPELPPGSFVFYSIFQWCERKNPFGLIKAYLSEFAPKDGVCLLLKTYLANHSDAERIELERMIAEARRDMGMAGETLPPIVLLVGNLPRVQVLALHQRGDCYVMPHRSEGWGVPLMEAMSLGKPTIATRYGGNLDFMRHDNSYLLDYQLTPVFGMPWIKTYRGDQMWAEPDLAHLKRLMREVYEDRQRARTVGEKAAADLRQLHWRSVGALMVERLQQLAGVPAWCADGI
jgi:glycosyltransferase involved in cell wall biosynthesis